MNDKEILFEHGRFWLSEKWRKKVVGDPPRTGEGGPGGSVWRQGRPKRPSSWRPRPT